MANNPSGIPIPTPIAIGRLAEDFWVWVGAGESVRGVVMYAWVWADKGAPVDCLAGEDAGMVMMFELGSAKEVVAIRAAWSVVTADVEDVTGGNPKIEPPV